jgi:succinoglycan biosynthesis protein ExoA
MTSGAAAVDCSVLIPVLNEQRSIEPMVAAMRDQSFDGRMEFVFADGGSTDRTREILTRLTRQDARIQLHHNSRGTVSSGLNVALGAARGTWVARMDAHTVYPREYVAHGIARLEAGGTRWVSGPQCPQGHNAVSRAFALAVGSPLGRGASRKWGVTEAARSEFPLDTGVFGGVWRRDTLLEYGGWDERWHANEDSELASRFLRRGELLICVPRMVANYTPRDSLGGLWRQYREYGRFRALTARRHPHSMRRTHLLAPALVADAALATVPGVVGTVSRRAGGVYAAALLAAGLWAWRRSDDGIDAALVPAVLATMHGAHGVGALAGAVEHGIPWAALARACGLWGGADRLEPRPESVFAPSLQPLAVRGRDLGVAPPELDVRA